MSWTYLEKYQINFGEKDVDLGSTRFFTVKTSYRTSSLSYNNLLKLNKFVFETHTINIIDFVS